MKTLKETAFADITETEWTSVLLALEYIESFPADCQPMLKSISSLNKIEEGETVHGISIVANSITEHLNS